MHMLNVPTPHPKSTVMDHRKTSYRHTVTNAKIVSRILYTAPTWWGVTNSRDRARIDRVMDNLKQSGFVANDAEDINIKVETTKVDSSCL